MKLVVYNDGVVVNEYNISNSEMDVGDEYFIGRAEDCHILLDDFRASRYHAVLLYEDGRVYILNKAEMNKALINGRDAEKVVVKNGDHITILSYTIEVDHLPSLMAEEDTEKTQVFATPSIERIEEVLPTDEETVLFKEESESNTDNNTDLDTSDSFEQDNDEDESEFQSNDQNLDANDEYSETEPEENFNSSEFDEDSGFNSDGFDSDVSLGDDDSFGGDEKTAIIQSFLKYYLYLKGEGIPFEKTALLDDEVFIGRDPETCQIVLNDGETSTKHAVLKKIGLKYYLEDLNSSNGTFLNDVRIQKEEINKDDIFRIGKVDFKVQLRSELIENERKSLMPVEENQIVEIEEIIEEEVEMDGGELSEFDDAAAPAPTGLMGKFSAMPLKKKILYTAVAIGLVFLLLDDTESEGEVVVKKEDSKEKVVKEVKDKNKKTKNFTAEQRQYFDTQLELAQVRVGEEKYTEAKAILDKIDPSYRQVSELKLIISDGLKEIARQEEDRRRLIEEQKRKKKLELLLEEAKVAVKDKQTYVAETKFSEIYSIDPENLEVSALKAELEAYKQQAEEEELEKQRKIAARKKMVDLLAPGKTLYLKEDWYKATARLEAFLLKKGMDQDLIDEATKMLKDSRSRISRITSPMLGKARSAKEGQDLKTSFEIYGSVLRYDPTNEEALNERDAIKEILDTRSKKVYREALISESLSLFEDAKEKFLEVKQISPLNSEYYKKAAEKLKNYLD